MIKHLKHLWMRNKVYPSTTDAAEIKKDQALAKAGVMWILILLCYGLEHQE